jgi:hypothetical protein
VLLGLETSPDLMAEAGEIIGALDKVILSVFVLEIALRLLTMVPFMRRVAIGNSISYSRSVVLAEFSRWPADSDGKARSNNPAGKTAPARAAGRPRKDF